MNLWPLRISFEDSENKGEQLVKWVLLAFCTLLLTIPFFLAPEPKLFGTHHQLWLPPCMFHYLTHIPCPFCGGTTSFAWMVRGNLPAAFLANPLAPIFFLYLVIIEFTLIVALFFRKTIKISTNLSLKAGIWLLLTMWGIKLLVWYAHFKLFPQRVF